MFLHHRKSSAEASLSFGRGLLLKLNNLFSLLRGGIVVERSLRLREIGVRFSVGIDLSL